MKKKINILIVEDEGIVAIDLKNILQRNSFKVSGIVKSGEDAIEFIRIETPDLILMDIMLAGDLSGIDTVQEIQRMNYDLPVIYVTANTDPSTLDRAKITDPFGYILKPFEEKSLVSTIDMALYKHEISKKLKESEERYRKLIELSPIGIGILSNRKVAYINPAGVKIFGASSADEMINKPLFDFVHPEFKETIKEKLRDVLVHKKSFDVKDEKLLRLDGSAMYVEFAVIPTQLNGSPAAQIVVRDVTEEKKKDKVQKATLRILQSANTSPDLDTLFVYLYGILNELMPAKNFYIAVHDHNDSLLKFLFVRDDFDEYIDRPFSYGLTDYVISNSESLLLNEEEVSAFGRTSDFEYKGLPVKTWLGVPFQIYNRTSGAIVVKDYTGNSELTSLEKELLELVSFPISRAIERIIVEGEKNIYTKKLKEVNDSKDKFFSVISHDLKSPFNSILGYIELLKNDFNELTDEEKLAFIEAIYQSTNNVYDHLNNLLEFSRFQTGRFNYNPEKVDFTEWLNENLGYLKGSLLKKELELKLDIQDNLHFYCDREMMDSIFQNIISNAIKFSERGQVITVSAKKAEQCVEMEIKDQGTGMKPELLESLFDIGKKSSVPGTENEQGTGLGLILAKDFLEKNGGSINVQSKLNEGTIIKLRIPSPTNGHI